ncbi:hypothetical protein [Oryzifoliimicrobium ureilyticus]|uniref:hypothetical protein n=1 Tax=Oryzifoliimicrobium ureilyticus TaxID=3113724 RepID=UPI0030767DA9
MKKHFPLGVLMLGLTAASASSAPPDQQARTIAWAIALKDGKADSGRQSCKPAVECVLYDKNELKLTITIPNRQNANVYRVGIRCDIACSLPEGEYADLEPSPKPVHLSMYRGYRYNGYTTSEVRYRERLGDLYLDLRQPRHQDETEDTANP